ncbi:2779_t:CDS:2, partial [Scutellospora calospora]
DNTSFDMEDIRKEFDKVKSPTPKLRDILEKHRSLDNQLHGSKSAQRSTS